jgi:pimeloyl-ACP methyl ester carboxylesterase
MRLDMKVMQLSDGRDLGWIDIGDPAGDVVFALHGSPGRCHQFTVHQDAALADSVRLIAIDRPGYGHSSYRPRRKLGDFPTDVAELADHLQVDRFAVIGHSAGGPHALACARFLPNRVSACGVVGSIAPSQQNDMTEGMMLTNRIQAAIYQNLPPALDPLVAVLGWLVLPLIVLPMRSGQRHPETNLDRFNRMLPDCDVEVISRPEIRAQLLAEAKEFTPATARTSIQDMALCFREWGFRAEGIDQPVHIWQGDLDRNVPLAHGQYLAEIIPNSTLHECRGEGHWLLVDHMGEILQAMAGSA